MFYARVILFLAYNDAFNIEQHLYNDPLTGLPSSANPIDYGTMQQGIHELYTINTSYWSVVFFNEFGFLTFGYTNSLNSLFKYTERIIFTFFLLLRWYDRSKAV